ncbi:MAG: replication factor C large subunit, partial [Thermoplasmatota archaeon]
MGRKRGGISEEEEAREEDSGAGSFSAPAPAPPQSSWAERYRPRSLREVVGNPRAVAELRKWAEEWEHGHPKKRAAILVGPPGTGKTSAALALAADMGWGVLELNASDARNYAEIRRVALTGAIHDTFTDEGRYISARAGGRKLVILDEADSLYEQAARIGVVKREGGAGGSPPLLATKDMGDRGGKRAIVETVLSTRQPVLLIVNDAYALTRGGGEALKGLCQTIRFDRLNRHVIQGALKRICEAEGVAASGDALEELSVRARGDLRAAINDLQSLCEGAGALRLESVRALGERDERSRIFDAMVEILKGTSIERARAAMRRVDEPPEFVLLWVDENLPLEYRAPEDLAAGYDALSRADVFLGRAQRLQLYGLWAYASDMMSAGVALAKRRRYTGFNKYRFPMWLVKRSRAMAGRRVESETLGRLASHAHLSTYEARHQMLPLFRRLFESDRGFALEMIRRLRLEEEHVAYILGAEAESPAVAGLMGAARGEAGATRRMGEFGGGQELAGAGAPGRGRGLRSGKKSARRRGCSARSRSWCFTGNRRHRSRCPQ